jgi:hypothetical protein
MCVCVCHKYCLQRLMNVNGQAVLGNYYYVTIEWHDAIPSEPLKQSAPRVPSAPLEDAPPSYEEIENKLLVDNINMIV